MLRLYFNHAWGSVRTESRSFSAEDGAVLLAGTGQRAKLPLFGFALPADDYPIAEWQPDGARLFPPPTAKLEQSRKGDGFFELQPDALERDGQRAFVRMTEGTSLRIREGEQILTVTLEDQKDRAGWDKKKFALVMAFMVIATLGLPIFFLTAAPSTTLVARALQDARVKQGLPAVHQPIDIAPVPQKAAAQPGPDGVKPKELPRTHVVLPTSVR